MTWASPTALWLWGGFGARHGGDSDGGYLDDVWTYPLAGGGWRRVGARGGGAAPEPRDWANHWDDGRGGVYVGGGVSACPKGDRHCYGRPLSDLWHFSGASRQWTLVQHSADPGPVYAPPEAATPGFRSNAYTATSANGETLYMVGGEGVLTAANNSVLSDGDFQDAWSFSVRAGRWTHLAGPKGRIDGAARYGERGVRSASNLMPAEHAGTLFGAPVDGQVWFLGGEDGREALGMRNDLWSFSVAAQEWTWHAGTAGYNGTARYSHCGAAGCTPAARYAGAGWTAAGSLFMFGAYGHDAHGRGGCASRPPTLHAVLTAARRPQRRVGVWCVQWGLAEAFRCTADDYSGGAGVLSQAQPIACSYV